MSDASSHVLSGEVLAAFDLWWRRIAHEAATGTNKADRAALRRCDTPTAVAMTSAFGHARRAIGTAHAGEAWRDWQLDRLAAAIGLAAHLKRSADDSPLPSLAQAMGTPRNPQDKESPPQVSELRFQRLLESPDMASLYIGVRRLLPLIDHRANPVALLRDLYGWSDVTRKRWAYAYYDPALVSNASDTTHTQP